jgi:hypothetical protein
MAKKGSNCRWFPRSPDGSVDAALYFAVVALYMDWPDAANALAYLLLCGHGWQPGRIAATALHGYSLEILQDTSQDARVERMAGSARKWCQKLKDLGGKQLRGDSTSAGLMAAGLMPASEMESKEVRILMKHMIKVLDQYQGPTQPSNRRRQKASHWASLLFVMRHCPIAQLRVGPVSVPPSACVVSHRTNFLNFRDIADWIKVFRLSFADVAEGLPSWESLVTKAAESAKPELESRWMENEP